MKLSLCGFCGTLLQFEEAACRHCGALQGFIPGTLELVRHHRRGRRRRRRREPADEAWRRCANAERIGCNWLVPADATDPRCDACRLNRNLADMAVPENLAKWRALECAKRRLLYALRRFGQPIASKKDGESAASPSTSSKEARGAR